MKLILASGSPRRVEILKEKGYDFEIVKSNFNECELNGDAKKIALNNADGKATEVINRLNDEDVVVLGADTIVVYEGKILGKPKSIEDAKNTLKLLSGKKHSVITGYSVKTLRNTINGIVESTVYFNGLSEDLIDEYVKSKKPLDKAGSYGIQDGFPLVKKYEGSLYNIIGLPIEDIAPILNKLLK